MPKLKSLKDLSLALDELKATAEFVRTELEIKQEWLNNKSDQFQASEKGQAWETYLEEVDTLLNDIESLETPDWVLTK